MKIGFISHGSPDYLADIVLDGLLRIHGRQNISVDCNLRPQPGASGPYQHLCMGITDPEPFDIHEAEVLVASSRSVKAVVKWKKRTGRTAIAILDGEDLGGVNLKAAASVKVYFKREYFHLTPYPPNVRPLSFGAIPEEFSQPLVVKRQVLYSGHDTHAFRKEIKGVLSSMGFPAAPNQDKRLYNKALSESLIGVSVRGLGWDTYRYWEIPYFGAALLAQRSPQVISENFVEGQEAVFYEYAEQFRKKLTHMIEHPDETEKIGKAGQKAVMERHLSVNRARTVLEAIA